MIDSWTTLDDFVLGFNGASSGEISFIDTARQDVPRKLSSAINSHLCLSSARQLLLTANDRPHQAVCLQWRLLHVVHCHVGGARRVIPFLSLSLIFLPPLVYSLVGIGAC